MPLPPFRNLPLLDFEDPASQDCMEQALASVRSRLGGEYDLIIGGRHLKAERTFHSFNPSHRDEVIGTFQSAGSDLVEPAMEAAQAAFRVWSRVPARERAGMVLDVAFKMRERRCELSAWMVLEVGKSWVEADADVAEAIDFCEFYAREMLRLAAPQPLVDHPSEVNELLYIPLGVGVIIPPWNFPLAILAGMTMAAVVSGNAVLVKPSSDSPAIAAQLMEICEEVGFPPGVINFVTGGGREIGEALVVHPRTRFISFTGSMAVGLRINELAARAQPGQTWIKRVVAEMGGKNAVIVDDGTDLEEAARGVAAAAFGFQGQKCSACSRAIVVESVYDEFVDILKRCTRQNVRPGDVENGDINFGPVINQAARDRITGYIDHARVECTLVTGGPAVSDQGYFVAPTIFKDVSPRSRLAQEEIFGPVLGVIKARHFDHALEIANDTVYGLTGAVYTNSEARLEQARQEFHVGNLYLNRKCTGALVGVHPFGGFNMSGTDSKAGGRDYLLLLTQAKAVARKR